MRGKTTVMQRDRESCANVDLRHTPSTEGLCSTSFLCALAHLPAHLSETTVVLFTSLRFSHVYRVEVRS